MKNTLAVIVDFRPSHQPDHRLRRKMYHQSLMGFLRKYLVRNEPKQKADTPDWASFMEPARFSRFQTRAEAEIRRQNPSAVIDWVQGTWTPAPGHALVLGLANLTQSCNLLKESKWHSEIQKFASIPQMERQDIKSMPFEEARTKLKVRLYPLDMDVPFMVTAPFCDSFYSALAIDFPDQVGLVPSDCIETWGVPVHELFKIGLDNVMAEDSPTISTIPDNSESSIVIFEGESFFTSSHALMLERHVQFDEESGLLVIIPNRHLTMFLKVSCVTQAKMTTLANLGKKLFDDGPGSITPDLLWLRRGQFERIELKDGKVCQNDDFAKHLNA